MGQGYQGSHADLIQVIQSRLGNTPTRIPYVPNWLGVTNAILDSSGSGTPRAGGSPPNTVQGVIEAIYDKYGATPGAAFPVNLYGNSEKGILEAFRAILSLGGGGEDPSISGIISLLQSSSSAPSNLTTNLTGSTGNWSIQISWSA